MGDIDPDGRDDWGSLFRQGREAEEGHDDADNGNHHRMDWGDHMITEYKNLRAPKAAGPWYTFTYENGFRASYSDWQGPIEEVEQIGRRLSKERGKEIRMRVHTTKRDRIHAVFRNGRKVL